MTRDVRRSARAVFDVVVPFGTGLFLVLLLLDPAQPNRSWLTLGGLLAAVVQGVALVWRRSRPLPVLLITLAGGLYIILAVEDSLFPFAALVALVSLTIARSPLWSLPALAAVLAVTAANFAITAAEDVYFAMAVAVALWALGEATRSRRVAIREESRRAVGEEQARIARELHDVIAHSVSVIVVQAAAADDVFDTRPDQARAALRSIEEAGREALGELRGLLGAVSSPSPSVSPSVSPSAAGPGLARLVELTAPLRAAGLEVAVHREGLAGVVLPAPVDLSAYRIVQEALTNTLRHAGASRASVVIRAAGGTLELDVRDDGRGAAGPPTGGRGLSGMRERAAMLGGTLDAGPGPDGGFQVRARLPLEGAR
jgi:signal transduction histidine kinase